jgi:hypothetical protein
MKKNGEEIENHLNGVKQNLLSNTPPTWLKLTISYDLSRVKITGITLIKR